MRLQSSHSHYQLWSSQAWSCLLYCMTGFRLDDGSQLLECDRKGGVLNIKHMLFFAGIDRGRARYRLRLRHLMEYDSDDFQRTWWVPSQALRLSKHFLSSHGRSVKRGIHIRRPCCHGPAVVSRVIVFVSTLLLCLSQPWHDSALALETRFHW